MSTVANPTAPRNSLPALSTSEKIEAELPPSGSRKWIWGTVLVGTLMIGGILAAVAVPSANHSSWLPQRRASVAPLTTRVKRMDLPIVVLAGGELASADARDAVCELEGQSHKIIEWLPEGTQVSAGDVVIRLDSSAIRDQMASQQIKVAQSEAVAKSAAETLKIELNLSASKVAQAELALQLAELDREKYLEGDYKVELSTLQGSIALAQAELQDAEVAVEHYRDLVKKGFRSPEELRAKEQELQRARYNLTRDEEKLKVLETFVRKRQLVELEAKAVEARRELERAKGSAAAANAKAQTDVDVALATAELERQQLARIQQQLEFCEVRAPADGVVVYVKDKTKPVELGGVVHFKQSLFSIPSSDQMKVNAFVHESVVKRVRPQLQAQVRIDAFSDVVLDAVVHDVAAYYDATRHWLSGGVKEYATTLTLKGATSVPLRLGMTAQVTILVEERPQAIVVPITSVAQKHGQHYCFVVADNQLTPRAIRVGSSTDQLVEVLSGLSEGEIIALDAALSGHPDSADDEAATEDAAGLTSPSDKNGSRANVPSAAARSETDVPHADAAPPPASLLQETP